MQRRLTAAGVLVAALLAAAPVTGQQPESRKDARVVMGLHFVGNRSIESRVLAAGIATTNSSWFARTPPFKWLRFLGEKRTFDELEFRRDVLRLQLLYKLSGFLEVSVDTAVTRTLETVDVTFTIVEGEPVRVRTLAVTGLDSVPDPGKITEDLPLRIGQPFNRFLLAASADSLLRRLRNRGYPSAQVFRNFEQQARERTASVTLEVASGRQGVIGPVVVEGTSPVDSVHLRKLLATHAGQLFSQEALYQSQRNLYRTELFQFASVGIDSARFVTGDSVVPLLIRVRQGRLHRIRGSVGYGTTDCFRGSQGWTARNFLGAGRILDLSGRVSKVGVGEPLGGNLDHSLCTALRTDSIGSRKLNYNVTAAVRRQGFLGPGNTVNLSLFAERRSEYKIFLREEIGGAFAVTRETSRRIPVTLGYKLSYGKTDASAATFCAFFSACTSDDIALLSQKRFLATVTGSASIPRTNSPLDPTRGWTASGEASVSSRFIGSASTQQFVKLVADAAWYRELTRGVVFSWRLRGGVILAPSVRFTSQSANFIPPEERFYAGGPNDVRGFQRNELGPVVFVLSRDAYTPEVKDSVERGILNPRFAATGGNTLAVGNVEMRFPSPIFSSRLRLALFVDAGTVWERDRPSVAPWNVRVTPGIGFRVGTPLGPARLDVAYNGYQTQPGALYLSKSDGTLALAQSDFVRRRRSKLTFQFAIGNPF